MCKVFSNAANVQIILYRQIPFLKKIRFRYKICLFTMIGAVK